jgi:hypothetical protein
VKEKIQLPYLANRIESFEQNAKLNVIDKSGGREKKKLAKHNI